MVVSDTVELGSLFHRKKKKASPPPVAPNTNFNFPAPAGAVTPEQIALMTQPGAIVAAGNALVATEVKPKASGAPGGPVAAPMGPTVAPTFLENYLPWVIGGGVLLAGIALVLIFKKSGNA